MSKLKKFKSQDIFKSYEDWKKVLLSALKSHDMSMLPSIDFDHPFIQRRLKLSHLAFEDYYKVYQQRDYRNS